MLLFGDGRLEVLASDLVLSDEVEDFYQTLDDGGMWMGVVPDLVFQTGGLEKTVFPLSESAADVLERDGLQVVASERMTELGRQMLSGSSLDGIAVGCE